jgi:hypothetical protein
MSIGKFPSDSTFTIGCAEGGLAIPMYFSNIALASRWFGWDARQYLSSPCNVYNSEEFDCLP